MSAKAIVTVASFISLAALSPVNIAGGGGGVAGATEVTQLANNVELMDTNLNTLQTVAEAVKQNAALANQYVLQGQQYLTQMQQLKNFVPEELQATYRNAVELKQSYDDLSGGISKLYGDVSNAKNSAENIFRDMSLKGLTPQQYISRIQSNTDRTKQNVQNMLGDLARSMKTVEASYDQVKAYQEKIPATEGVHQSMQLLNSQMNAMLVQNGQFVELSMAALKNQVEDSSKKVAEQENSTALSQAISDEKSRFAKEFKKTYFGDSAQ